MCLDRCLKSEVLLIFRSGKIALKALRLNQQQVLAVYSESCVCVMREVIANRIMMLVDVLMGGSYLLTLVLVNVVVVC